VKAPLFQWYAKDWETDERVRLMGFDAFGLLVHCLNYDWLNGGLPADLGDLAHILGSPLAHVRRIWPRVAPFFVERDGRLFNPELERQRRGYEEFRESRQNAANARWCKHSQCESNAHALQLDKKSDAHAMHEECSASASAFAFSREESQPIATNGSMASCQFDESYTPFVEVYRGSGAALIDNDFAEAHWEWRRMDFEQQLLAIYGVRDLIIQKVWGRPGASYEAT
jgi:hypothetical protein